LTLLTLFKIQEEERQLLYNRNENMKRTYPNRPPPPLLAKSPNSKTNSKSTTLHSQDFTFSNNADWYTSIIVSERNAQTSCFDDSMYSNQVNKNDQNNNCTGINYNTNNNYNMKNSYNTTIKNNNNNYCNQNCEPQNYNCNGVNTSNNYNVNKSYNTTSTDNSKINNQDCETQNYNCSGNKNKNNKYDNHENKKNKSKDLCLDDGYFSYCISDSFDDDSIDEDFYNGDYFNDDG
jgi:hypothetical protein